MLARVPFIAVTAILGGVVCLAQAGEPMPRGVKVIITLAGPTLVDPHGSTLYKKSGSCHDDPETVRPQELTLQDPVDEFPMRVPDAGSWRSCTTKYPPFLAEANAQPVGNWTIHLRENGVRQWAFKGDPLYTSIRDSAPGDVSGWFMMRLAIGRSRSGWEIAAPPLQAPAGIETRLTSLGLALTNSEGRPLYYLDTHDNEVSASPEWRALLAPAVLMADRLPLDWSIVKRSGDLRQWAWKGKPLYTHSSDRGDDFPQDAALRFFVDVFGDTYGKPPNGWRVALLKEISSLPSGVRVRSIGTLLDIAPRIYTDAEGRTLYSVTCVERTHDAMDCDYVGDSPRYWLSFCGGEERCRRSWRPLTAPADAKSIDGLWSVSIINPSHPFRPLEGRKGLPVWSYQGRLVFTYAGDEKPGDVNGLLDRYSAPMVAYPIPALGRQQQEIK